MLEVRVSSSLQVALLLRRLAWQGRKAEGGAEKATYPQARAGNHLAPAQLVKQQQGEKSVILPGDGFLHVVLGCQGEVSSAQSTLKKNPAVPNLFFFPVASPEQELKEDQCQTTEIQAAQYLKFLVFKK